MITLGIDVGNSGCKVGAFDEDVQPLKLARRSYSFDGSSPRSRELDAEQVYRRVVDCLTEVCADGVGADVCALAVSSQGEAVIVMDREGTPVAPVHASFDERSGDVLQSVYDSLEDRMIERVTGNPRHAMFSLFKLVWLQRNDPECLERGWKIATFADWIAFRLCGELVMDYTAASRTSLLDVAGRRWSTPIAQAVGLPENLLPDLAPSGTPVARIRASVADLTGISRSAVVATGGHDQICCALGAGICDPGLVMNSMGTTDSVVTPALDFDRSEELASSGMAIGRGVGDSFAMHGYVMSTGSAIDWFRRTFSVGDQDLALLDAQAWNRRTPSGIQFLPHLTGSGTPHLDIHSKGVLIGLTTESTPPLIYQAILEGICLELKENLEMFSDAGVTVGRITAIGGAARSDDYLKLKASIFGLPVVRTQVVEAGARGAAILAGCSAGRFEGPFEASRATTAVDRVFDPDEELHAMYARQADTHRRIYWLFGHSVGVMG